MTRLRIAIASVALATAISTISTGPASAGYPASAEHPPGPATLDLARDRGISTHEAAQRMRWQRHAHELHSDLVSGLDREQYGGLWIGLHDDRIKVGLVDKGTGGNSAATRTIRSLARDHQVAEAVDIVRVPHSLVALIEANDWLGGELARVNAGAPWPLEAGYVTDRSVVRLGLPAKSEHMTAAQREVVDKAIRRFGYMLVTYTYASRVAADECYGVFCDPPLRAGVRINPVGCTTGFIGRSRSDAKLYTFTAGHCVDGDPRIIYSTHLAHGTVREIGPRHNFVFGLNGDLGIIAINQTSWTARGWVFVWPSNANNGVPGTTYNETYPIRGDGTSTLHMRVCKSGISQARTSCGRVTQLDVTVTYESGETVRNLIKTSYCSLGGDSGGPVFAAGTAYGIHVAGSDNCSGAFYQDIRRAESAMNVDVAFD